MDWCNDVMILAFKTGLFLLAVLFKVAFKFSKLKKPFDEKKKPYRFWKDFWPYYNDNAVIWLIGGAIGATTAGAWVGPLVSKVVELDMSYELAIELFFVVAGSLLGSWILGLFIRD